MQHGLEHYRRVGDLLLKAKERCGHGKFLPWLKANFPFSRQHAANYMRLAERWANVKPGLHLKEALRMLIREKELPFHPLTEVKPRMDEWMFQRLKQSILHVGLLQPIVVHKGMIVTGGSDTTPAGNWASSRSFSSWRPHRGGNWANHHRCQLRTQAPGA
jgi:hypothetical protein